MKANKLVEITMPIKGLSSESIKVKYIRHRLISTLHFWWVRKPFPTYMTLVFTIRDSVPDLPIHDVPPAPIVKACKNISIPYPVAVNVWNDIHSNFVQTMRNDGHSIEVKFTVISNNALPFTIESQIYKSAFHLGLNIT